VRQRWAVVTTVDTAEVHGSLQLLASNSSLVFLKTHKTGSSTLSGVLWRQLSQRQALNCFVPPAGNPGRTWDMDRAEDRRAVMRSSGTTGAGAPFDVWLHYARRSDFLLQHVVKAPAGQRQGQQQGQQQQGLHFVSIVRRPALLTVTVNGNVL
jgi:hypothetical protein